jgi:hypothetical protein
MAAASPDGKLTASLKVTLKLVTIDRCGVDGRVKVQRVWGGVAEE